MQGQRKCIEKINKTESGQKEGKNCKINEVIKLVSIKIKDNR
jgi:hypothetical protein